MRGWCNQNWEGVIVGWSSGAFVWVLLSLLMPVQCHHDEPDTHASECEALDREWVPHVVDGVTGYTCEVRR